MEEKSLYKPSAKYYDLLVDKKEIEKEANFISKILKKYQVKSILDIGCGTGLYLLPLKKKRFLVEGLDLSKEMLREAKKR